MKNLNRQEIKKMADLSTLKVALIERFGNKDAIANELIALAVESPEKIGSYTRLSHLINNAITTIKVMETYKGKR